jgi:hypothetical protein
MYQIKIFLIVGMKPVYGKQERRNPICNNLIDQLSLAFYIDTQDHGYM